MVVSSLLGIRPLDLLRSFGNLNCSNKNQSNGNIKSITPRRTWIVLKIETLKHRRANCYSRGDKLILIVS